MLEKKLFPLATALVLAVTLFFVQVRPSAAAVIDTPHTEANAVSCGSCHSYSLWWQYSPIAAKSSYPELSNAVCSQCHGSAGTSFVKAGHSTSSMGTPHPVAGSWSTQCLDCHDPHTQQQLRWLPTNPVFNDGTLAGGFFLVEGTMAAITDNGDGTTTFHYTNGLAKSGWFDPADWSMKSGHDGRGLILSLGYGKAEHTYEVTAATMSIAVSSVLPATGAGTITVQTGSDLLPVQYDNSPFGLFYGQLVKNVIKTPHNGNRDVKLLDGKDGLVTTTTTPRDGVCQVCHTVTKYWRNDGDPDPSTGILHNATITCTACHRSETGFKPSGGPHTFLGESSACVTCHHSGDILGVHNNNCQNCHTTPPTLADPNDKPLASQLVRGTCQDCHGAIAVVHASESIHDHRQKNVSPCVTCHTITSQTAIDSLHKQCETCHLYSGTKLSASVVAEAIATGTGSEGSAISCQTCHAAPSVGRLHHGTARAANNQCVRCHTTVDHRQMVKDSTTPVCVGCHTGTAATGSGISVNPADPKIHFSCRTCHTFDADKRGILVNFTNRKGVNGSGQLPDGGSIGGSDGGGVCSNCHTESAQTFHHRNPHVAVGECEQCHVDPRPSKGHYQPGDNGGPSKYPTQLACRECHVRFVDGAMTVTKYTRTNYTDLSTPWIQTTQHAIFGVTLGQINNYGICFSCHGEGTATKVMVFHARPDKHGSNNAWNLGSKNWRRRGESLGFDQAHYAAGRSSSGIGGLNYFSASYEAMLGQGLPTGDRPPNSGAFFQNWYDHYTSPRAHLHPYKSYWSAPYIIPIQATPLNANTYGSVIVLPALASQTIAGATADPVHVDHAVYNGTDLIVIATNSDGCDSLTASYGGTDLAMNGTFNCTAIFTGVNYPADGTTVDVTTANKDGIHVMGYPIANQSGGVAVNDFYPAYCGIAKPLSVMTNDLGTGLSLQSVGEAGHGKVAISGETVLYTATAGYSGDDSFSYTVTDSDGKTSEATVTIAVAINQAPIPGADAYTVVAGGGEVTFNVQSNDIDGDGDPLTITSITQPLTGTVVLDGATILFTPPAAGYDGDVTFTYQTSDGMGHDVSGEVTVTIATPRDWVTVLDPWQQTPQLSHAWLPSSWGADGYFHLPQGTNFTVSRGLNRLILVSINVYTGTPGPMDKDLVKATYGDKTLTKAVITQSATTTHNFISYLGYLNEEDIVSTSGNELNVAVATGYKSVTVSIASYSNVNQSSPIAASGGNKYNTGNTASPVIAPATGPLPVHAGQYVMYNRSTSSCGSGVFDNEGYALNIDFIDHAYSTLYGINVGMASKLINSDNTTNPLLPEGTCSADGAASLLILDNISSSSVTVDTDLDGVGELLDLCPDSLRGESVNNYGCAQSQVPDAAVISQSSPTYTVIENLTAAIKVSRSGSSLEEVTVNYATTNSGTAVPGSHFYPVSGTLTWVAGDMADKIVYIGTTWDQKYNLPDKTIGFALSSPSGVTAVLGDPSTAEVTIVNRDPEPAVISFNPSSFTVDEDAGTAVITVSRTGSSTGAVEVSYETREGSAHVDQQYLATSGALHWDADDMADKTFSVTILDNNVFYPLNLYLSLVLSHPSSGAVLGSYNARPGESLWAGLTIIDNDIPSGIGFSSPTYTVNEDDPTGMATITVKRSGSSTGEVWVYGETQIGDLAYEYKWITLHWLDGDMTDKTVNVPINNDSVYAADKSIEIKLYYASNSDLYLDTAPLTIVNDDPIPPSAIIFSDLSYSVNEDDGTATITVSRTGVPTGAVCAGYLATAGGTAKAGVDYIAEPGTLCWADGDMADKTFEVGIVDNSYHGVNKTVNLVLSSHTGDAFLGNPNKTALTIVDNETPVADTTALTSATYSINENDGTATITVSRFGNSTGPLSVGYATTEGGTATAGVEYTATSGTLIWAEGDLTDKTLSINIIDNAVYAGDKTVNVMTTATGNPNLAVLTIVDNESVVEFASSTYTVNESGGTVNITVRRTGSSKGEFWVTCPLVNGTSAYQYSDYNGPTDPHVLYWADGDMGDKTLTFTIIDDTLVEPDEKMVLGLNTSAGSGNATLGVKTTTVLTIIDNDDAAIAFTASAFTVTETDSAATITVSRSGYSTGPVTVDYATKGGGTATAGVDYTVTSGTLSWANGDMGDKSFTIPISYTVEVGDKSVNMTLSSPTGHATIQGVINTAVLTIVDNAVTFAFSSSTYSVNENEGTATITVKRLGGATDMVHVSYENPYDPTPNEPGEATGWGSINPNATPPAGTDYRYSIGVLNWAAGDTTDKTFTVTIYDDAVHEGNETVNLRLYLGTPPGIGLNLGTPNTAVLTIIDND